MASAISVIMMILIGLVGRSPDPGDHGLHSGDDRVEDLPEGKIRLFHLSLK